MSYADRLDKALDQIRARHFKPDTIHLPPSEWHALERSAAMGTLVFSGPFIRYRGVGVVIVGMFDGGKIDAHAVNVPGKVKTFRLVSQRPDTPD